MAELVDIRTQIDALDAQLRELMMRRMDCSRQVAAAKLAAGSTEVFRAEREAQILERLGSEVPSERRSAYLASVRKLIECSRSYQYALMYAQLGDAATAQQLPGAELLQGEGRTVEFELTRAAQPGALATALGFAAEKGFRLVAIEQLGAGEGRVSFRLVLEASPSDPQLRCLLWQLAKESLDLRITAVR
ncbi:MAG: chorismate mutase [Coriobacteriales bacterium]